MTARAAAALLVAALRRATAAVRWDPGARIALALLPLALWAASDAAVPRISFSRERLWMAADLGAWQWPSWGWLPLATTGLIALRQIRQAVGVAAVTAAAAPIGAPAAVLCALRLLSLWSPASALLPWLSLTWSPHASLALALAAAWPAVAARPRAGVGAADRCAAVAVAALALLGYVAYTLYVCQMAMLHGDESQYLRVTQSLLRDGDIDLSDNLDMEHVTEFHVLDFGVHAAPSAPPGRVYSIHPVGLSVLLVPAYDLGLRLWANPRLGCALLMAVLAAAVAGALYLFLRRLGYCAAAALATTGVCATTAPLLLFSTQLYPELPAVLIALIVLVRLPPGLLGAPAAGAGRGATSPWELAGLGLLLGALPFLHARYAPLAGLLGLGLLAVAVRSPLRRAALGGLAAAAVVAVGALVPFHYAFSGDWMGPFRPGNAWDEHALEPATWLISLPGHWLHATRGLAISSPVFFVAGVAGVAVLARARDRRLAFAVALYASTALVNGLHPDWTFGFCLPARFLLTALPALSVCVAAGLECASVRPWLALAIGAGLALSWDTAAVAVVAPEMAYEGEHLPRVALSRFYPFVAHGFRRASGVAPLVDLALWAAVAAAVAVAAVAAPALRRRRCAVGAIVVAAALAPVLWGRSAEAARLRTTVSPELLVPSAAGPFGEASVTSAVSRHYGSTTGMRTPDGGFRATPQDSAGVLTSYYLPVQSPGLYRVTVDHTQVEGAPQTAVLSLRRTLPALQEWDLRRAFAIQPGGDGAFRFDYYLDRPYLGYLYFLFAGGGTLQVGAAHMEYLPRRLHLVLEEAGRYDFTEAGGQPFLAARDELPRGRYVARYRLAGHALSALAQRRPPSVRLAAFVADGGNLDFAAVQGWYRAGHAARDLVAGGAPVPQAQVVAAPWWTCVPFAGDDVYELTFLVRQAGTVWLLYGYDGPDLHLEEIVAYRQSLRPEEKP